tara:strand:+ start:177 stop:593 length:417 start_codon:yes stop_codon:yes gene_type:complete
MFLVVITASIAWAKPDVFLKTKMYLPFLRFSALYPMEAARNQISGFCTLQFDVAESGGVENPQVLACSPEGYFERPSIEALSRFRYQPSSYRVAGVVEAFWFSAEINSEYSHWKNLGVYNRVKCREAVHECHAVLAAP